MAKGPESVDPFDSMVWDTETRNDFSLLQGHVRDSGMYIPTALWAAINEAFGGVTAYFRTSTDEVTGKVTVAKATAKTPGAIEVKAVGAMNSAQWSVWRILKKLDLTVPPNRQFNIPATISAVGRHPVVIFDFAQRQSVPRNRKEEDAVKEATEGDGKNNPGTEKIGTKEGAAPGAGAC